MKPAILTIEKKCTGCGACVSICPRECLHLAPDDEGFYYPVYDETKCIDCHLCEKTCKAIYPQDMPIDRNYIYVYHSIDESLREQSTSGGAFTSFANMVLSKGGVVFATRFNAKSYRAEVSDTDCNELDSFRKSKYVESYVGDAFQKIADQLNKGRKVLFCGTPCQVAGLQKYLAVKKIDKKNLITIDFVCHGVPSMKCLSEFLHYEERGKKKVVNVDFRYKDFTKKKTGWHNMVFCAYFEDGGKRVLKPLNLHYYYYYLPFLEDRNLRKSCYTCNQVLYSCADVTVGDFWGISRYKSIIDDNKGLSFLQFNNRTLEKEWCGITKNDFVEKIPFAPNEKQYGERPANYDLTGRNQFYEMVNKYGYMKTVKKMYMKRYYQDWASKLLRFVKIK